MIKVEIEFLGGGNKDWREDNEFSIRILFDYENLGNYFIRVCSVYFIYF